ncbi:MAG: hypothetical protein KA257_10925 [Opitutaceae bacterium]|jgi:hypothetical protein|nr:hypothetical protein [Opitutaceae bacterium]HQY04509.1 hypothetical protein [Lacunisphaera sp.]
MSNNTLEPKELAQVFAKINSIGHEMIEILLTQAKEAAESGETNWLVQVGGDARDIEDCMVRLESIRKRMHEILTETLGFADQTEASPEDIKSMKGLMADLDGPVTKRLRRIRTQITQGEINQNLLTLTSARKRGHIRLGETFKIKLPDGQDFETELVQPGNKLRERGLIGGFYRQQVIKTGDYVLMEETEPGVWTLTKETPPSPIPPI